jgi:hypothetical protein
MHTTLLTLFTLILTGALIAPVSAHTPQQVAQLVVTEKSKASPKDTKAPPKKENKGDKKGGDDKK